MARNANASKSIVKLQALVRGFLVRKKFTQLKSEYNDMVKCIEGTDAKVCWKNNEVLCFPVVFHGCSETRERCDVLSENRRQKTLSSNEVGRGDSNTMEKSQIQSSLVNEMYYRTSSNDSSEHQNLVRDCESTSNFTSKDCVCTDVCFHVAPTFDHDGSHGTGDESVDSSAINGCEIPPEVNVKNIETQKKQHGDMTDEIKTNVGDQDIGSHHTTYPRDELSLLKLREDLTMELLWIEQAIESRINYLAMKKNMDKNN